ncbi:MAG: hypothetical protein IPJ23_05915 [Ignavibacteriales bacterium]|nr:hypothetical protein [Ignavibacteriales bacterium]
MSYLIQAFQLGYVYERVGQIEEINTKSGGISIDRILDGSALNRETAFRVSREKYESKGSWLVGYGWGITENNRAAFYVDTDIERGSAHSQIYATLFILGWLGFIAYWGLLIRIIYKSYKFTANQNIDYARRLLSFSFLLPSFYSYSMR